MSGSVVPVVDAAPATVQFGLLASVELLATTAFLALAVAGVWPRLRARGAPVLAVAALLLAAPEVLTGFRFGNSSGTLLSGLRALGALVLAVALTRGALRPPIGRDADGRDADGRDADGRDADGRDAGGPRLLRRLRDPRTAGSLVIVPLGASVPVAWLAAAAFAVAAVAAWPRPLRLRLPLMAGLLCDAGAELLAPAARTSSTAAVQLLLLRGLGALCLLAVLVALARASVLGRVASVIFTAVLLTATGAVAVAGTVATSSLEREQSDTARQLYRAAQVDLDGQVRRTGTLVGQLTACRGGPLGCASLVPPTAAVLTVQGTTVRRVAGSDDAALVGALPRVPAVAAALRTTGAASRRSATELAVVVGRPDRLVVVGVSGADRTGRRVGVVVPVDLRRLTSARSADLGVLLLPGGQGVASTFPPSYATRLAGLLVADAADVARSSPGEPAVLLGLRGRGRAAAAPLAPVVGAPAVGAPAGGVRPSAVLAVAPRDDGLLQIQRHILAGLFLGLAATAICVGLLGVLLGAGLVRPIRRITDAARRVRAGQAASAGPGGPDELGELARAFDAMTTSLTGTQDELRRTAEREASTRARLSVVLDSLGDGLLVVDDAGTVTDSNPAARHLLGTDPVGRPLGQVLPDGDDVVLESGRAARYLSVRRTPLAEGGGTVVLLRDRTREREAERMKTEFLANVSHELRTPLTPVRGYAELLRRRRATDPDQVAEHAGVIAAAAERMSRVVDLLVDVAALDAGRVTPSVAPMPVGPFLAERVAVWRRRRPDRADDLLGPDPGRLPLVSVDSRWIAKAVDELIDNAVKYTSVGTMVALEAVVLDGSAPGAGAGRRTVRIGVRDQGPGLDEAARTALYDDFAQADGSVTRARDGLGLGLPFVRRVAALFDLELVVESTPGNGAFFGLLLPTAPRPAPRPGPGAVPQRSSVERTPEPDVPMAAPPVRRMPLPGDATRNQSAAGGSGSGTSRS